MKVLHVNDHLAPRGGVETYLLSVIPYLEQDGFEQAVAYGQGDAGLVKYPFEIPELSRPGWGEHDAVTKKLGVAIDAFQPDVVHLHNIHNADAVEFLLDRKPVVMTSHDFRYLCPASNFYFRKTESVCERSCGMGCFGVTLANKCMTLRPRFSWKYYRRVIRVARRFRDFRHLIAPCQDAANRFIRDGFPRENVTVLPYFCRIKPLENPRPVPKQPLILYLGRLSGNKGWQYFIHALGMMPGNVNGVIIGNVDGPAERRLVQLADVHRCRDRLSWRNWATQEEISTQLRMTSVLVFPSLWPETLGIVGLEAMAHGVPIVASDIGGVPEWLRDGQNGFRVPPRDGATIAARIRQIIDDPVAAAAMGINGLAFLKERFLPEQHLSVLKNIYMAAA
jgi:glycosyltransferase involved in cell wall biosynthesis